MQDAVTPQRPGTWRLCLAALLIAVCGGSSAFAETLTCRMDPGGKERYIAREVSLSWDEYGAARVEDAVIKGTGRTSVPGIVVPSSPSKLVATWDVSGVKPDPLEYRKVFNARLVVRLAVQRADGAAVMSVSDGSDRRYTYRATGTCTFGA